MLATKAKLTTLKFLVFAVGNLHFALRLDGVKKVIPTPEIFKSGDKLLGITQVEDQEVIVLDLHQAIFGFAAVQSKGYLVVVQTQNNRYGVTAAILPMMQDLLPSEFRPIPADYRDRDALGIAEQMAQITLENQETTTVFLLDPERLLSLTTLLS